MTKKIHLDAKLVKDLFNSWSRKNLTDWEFVAGTDYWDGGEERYNSVVVKNIKENYYIEITNTYDSWDTYWDPTVSVVNPVDRVTTVTDYLPVDGVEVVV